jgi:hypothetical protein
MTNEERKAIRRLRDAASHALETFGEMRQGKFYSPEELEAAMAELRAGIYQRLVTELDQ